MTGKCVVCSMHMTLGPDDLCRHCKSRYGVREKAHAVELERLRVLLRRWLESSYDGYADLEPLRERTAADLGVDPDQLNSG